MEFKKSKIDKILLTVLVVLLIAMVGLSVQTAGYGTELAALERSQAAMLKDKNYLEEQLAKSTSLKLADKRAKKLRFDKDYELVYLNNPESFAQLFENR